jgi:hypothetical protein
MKADVFPHGSVVPEPIAKCIKDISSSAFWRDDIVAMFHNPESLDHQRAQWAKRKASIASTMEGVWRELSRRTKNGFRYPALTGDPETSPEARQEAAVVELFNAIVDCLRRDDGTTTTQKQAEQERDKLLIKAEQLRFAGNMLMGSPDRGTLLDAARVYENLAHKTYANRMATALQRQHDGRARWVAITISSAFKQLYLRHRSLRGPSRIPGNH